MPANIEIKARITDRDATIKLVEWISDSKPVGIYQEDTFFFSPKGRLKLRVFADSYGELIYYERPDTCEPGLSEYQSTRLSDPEFVKNVFRKNSVYAGRYENRGFCIWQATPVFTWTRCMSWVISWNWK